MWYYFGQALCVCVYDAPRRTLSSDLVIPLSDKVIIAEGHMRWRTLAIGLSGMALAGCGGAGGERYVATANESLLVVLEDVVPGGIDALSSATVHYILAAPQPLEESRAQGRLVQRMTYKSRFDCEAGTWGSLSRSYTFQDGGTLEATETETTLQTAAADSVAGRIIATIGDPAIAEWALNRRSLEALEWQYRAAL